MKINEIKRTVEEVVRTEYVAEDGTVFYDEGECEKYEKSALFEVSKRLKRLTKELPQDELVGNLYGGDTAEFFNVENEEDLSNLKRYIYLRLSSIGKASETTIKDAFSRCLFGIDNITSGHEVLILWYEANDWVYTFGDGSINAALEYHRNKLTALITQKDESSEEE